ncbi:MAG: 6-pyruvoyl tetrahydropterin synthase family protein [Candidatus Thermoplasmatota archaeon]|nr:6-pyruvoyl tetrahydropterin synthase family protein [Candidatus Thermoplasmatota archaeon]MBS3789645.1 6-pyruvoyl tetrahydropterin synthase family protein [Candidatus Thermoplasmatota archaeon]
MSTIKLKVDGWEKSITFSASHILPGHEKCGRIHGHNYAIHVRISGEPSESGVVFDFLPIKEKLREIADRLDHRVLIASGMEGLKKEENEIMIQIENKRYVFPEEDALILDIDQVTAEQLAMYLLEEVVEEVDFPEKVNSVEIGVDESRGQGAWARKEI